MHQVIVALQKDLQNASHKQVAIAQSAYMRDQFPFFGIKKAELTKIVRTVFKQFPLKSEDELIALTQILWNLEERDYQYAALELLFLHKKLWSKKLLYETKSLITIKSWWDTVDFLAPHIVGTLALKYPEFLLEVDTWILNENKWLRRSALLYQLRFKAQTDSVRLFNTIQVVAHEKEFFICKAIGWALREYSKTDPQLVKQFLLENKNSLSGLSYREALKYL